MEQVKDKGLRCRCRKKRRIKRKIRKKKSLRA
jgi:hypothetical protein